MHAEFWRLCFRSVFRHARACARASCMCAMYQPADFGIPENSSRQLTASNAMHNEQVGSFSLILIFGPNRTAW